MRATGYILWALCAQTAVYRCGLLVEWSASALHIMREEWERWWTDSFLNHHKQLIFFPFLLLFPIFLFIPLHITTLHFRESFAFSFHIVILLLFITPSLLAPHFNLTTLTPPLPQTNLSANHIASDTVLTKVCFPGEKNGINLIIANQIPPIRKYK